jgi:ParB/RepB/Spo0J family partition protein
VARTGEVMMVRHSDVYVGGRVRQDMGDVKDLASDIKENGLINPITVRPPNETERELGVDQPYILIAGGRRYGATMMLGWPEIPIYVRETMDELKHRIIELHENVKRKQMTWPEEAQAMQEIVQIREAMAAAKGEKITQAEIAIELNINKGTLTRNIQAAEAIQAQPELKKASSRKAAMRVREVVAHNERLTAQQVIAEQKSKRFEGIASRIVTADAKEFIRLIPSKTVDLVLTDPPFGLDYYKTGHKMRSGGANSSLGMAQYDDTADTALDLLSDLVPQWIRVLRETGWLCVFMNEENYDFLREAVVTCCATHLEYRDNHPAAQDCRYVTPHPIPWIWYRPNSRNRPRYPERHAQNVYEKILVCNMGKGQLTAPCQNLIVCDAEYGNERVHDHQKPLELAKELVRRFTVLGDTVLDTTYGSGMLLAGAAVQGRYIMGSELNPSMRDIALGFIRKYEQPAPSKALTYSKEKYLKALETVPVEPLYDEVEDVA